MKFNLKPILNKRVLLELILSLANNNVLIFLFWSLAQKVKVEGRKYLLFFVTRSNFGHVWATS